jgi:hypothetical protein
MHFVPTIESCSSAWERTMDWVSNTLPHEHEFSFLRKFVVYGPEHILTFYNKRERKLLASLWDENSDKSTKPVT